MLSSGPTVRSPSQNPMSLLTCRAWQAESWELYGTALLLTYSVFTRSSFCFRTISLVSSSRIVPCIYYQHACDSVYVYAKSLVFFDEVQYNAIPCDYFGKVKINSIFEIYCFNLSIILRLLMICKLQPEDLKC